MIRRISRVAIGVGLAGFALLSGGWTIRELAFNHAVHAFKAGQGSAALDWLTPLATLGDNRAKLLVGTIYAFGLGDVRPNEEDAVIWFRRIGGLGLIGIEPGIDPAMPYELDVAKAYAYGRGAIRPDKDQSLRRLRRAASSGNPEAQRLLIEQQEMDAPAAAGQGARRLLD